MGKATNFKFGRYIQRVHTNKSRLKIWEKMERGHIQELRNFFEYPYYLTNGQSYELQIWQVYSHGPSEQKPFKNLGENGAWAYPGTAQISWVYPLLSQERIKLRTSNFVRTFLVSIGTKAHYKFRTLETFQGTLYWAHRAVIFAIAQLSCLVLQGAVSLPYCVSPLAPALCIRKPIKFVSAEGVMAGWFPR